MYLQPLVEVEMAPKIMSTVTVSRRLVICDHCGKEYMQRNLREHTKRVHPGFPYRERLSKGQGKLRFTTDPKPKRPRTDLEQDELAALDQLPEESTELACLSCERVFYNEDDLNYHEMTTHIT